MKKINVIRKNHQFQKIISLKNQSVSRELIIYKLKNNYKLLRIGISVSKKFANAVGRNKYKRKIRSALDKINLYNDISYDIVIIIRKPFLKLSFEEMNVKLEKMIKRVKDEQQ